MPNAVYMVMGNQTHDGWSVLRVIGSRTVALGAARELMDKYDTHKSRGSKTWSFWTGGRAVYPPRDFPGKFVESWTANSVGGLGGNPWSEVAVAEVFVEDAILDQLAEAL